MAKITNIYVTHKEHGIDSHNFVVVKVLCNDGNEKLIECTKSGFPELKASSKNYSAFMERMNKGYVADLMKIKQKNFLIYTNGNIGVVFAELKLDYGNFVWDFYQPVFIRENVKLRTQHIFGGFGLEEVNSYFKKTDKTLSKQTLINDTIKELKVCYPELKITFKETNKNLSE